MRLTTLRKILLSRLEAVEEYPFGPEVMVLKVCGKMFAAVIWEASPLQITVKCDPSDVGMLRELSDSIQPPRYFDKRHWNTLILDGDLPRREVENMIGQSWRLVVSGLKKADRERLLAGGGD